MNFLEVRPTGLDVDTATGNLYFTWNNKLKRFTKNDNTQINIYTGTSAIFGIAIDTLTR